MIYRVERSPRVEIFDVLFPLRAVEHFETGLIPLTMKTSDGR
jgi:hypothetical protein